MNPGACECNGSGEACAVFAISCGESAELLEFVEAAFDAVTELIERLIVGSLDTSIGFGRDHSDGSHSLNPGYDGVAVIALIGDDNLRLLLFQESFSLCVVAALAWGKTKLQR